MKLHCKFETNEKIFHIYSVTELTITNVQFPFYSYLFLGFFSQFD